MQLMTYSAKLLTVCYVTILIGIKLNSKNLTSQSSCDGKSISTAAACMMHTSKMAKDSIVVARSSLSEPMKRRTSIRLNANGMSTMAFRKRSAGPSWDRSPLKSLSLSSSSDVGAIFSKVWRNSGGSSCPDQPKRLQVFHTNGTRQLNNFTFKFQYIIIPGK